MIRCATAAFASDGPEASLEEIARNAGVAVGTLYRHFPTREALYIAVHRSELMHVAQRADELLALKPPLEALRQWLIEFVELLDAKKGKAQLLLSVMADGGNPFVDLRTAVYDGAQHLLAAAAAEGLRQDVDAADLIVAMHGISLGAMDAPQAARLIELIMSGLLNK
ncbi:hypothetical protein AWC23_04000 [Mycobacterium saskatchewanense]|uniref:HTH tetR-type domain-containing protein n=1 Tax=Mycobacterium saskatchewanense TaxID=220927 RepID=A0AAJ3TWZ1_9MYCO|nr:hypothetical protein AWC23_04000 [Mycobacterium saskatchewanense]